MNRTQSERRRYRRYIVTGDVQLFQGRFIGSAQLVQLGLGGMLLRGGHILPPGANGYARFKAAEYREQIEVHFEVVGQRNALMAVKFLTQPRALAELVQWLAFGGYPVAGLEGRPASDTENNERCSISIPRWTRPADREAAIAFMFR